jgi:hypothetical protein
VLNSFAIRNRHNTVYSLVLAAGTAVLANPAAHASVLFDTPDCSASGDSLKCHLLQILSFLYVVSGILAFVLLIVLAIVIRIYLKNKSSKQVRS